MICPQAVDLVENGEELSIDFENGVIVTPRGECRFSPFPAIVEKVMSAGGLIPYVNAKIAERQSQK